jgi:hypothetical protein
LGVWCYVLKAVLLLLHVIFLLLLRTALSLHFTAYRNDKNGEPVWSYYACLQQRRRRQLVVMLPVMLPGEIVKLHEMAKTARHGCLPHNQRTMNAQAMGNGMDG